MLYFERFVIQNSFYIFLYIFCRFEDVNWNGGTSTGFLDVSIDIQYFEQHKIGAFTYLWVSGGPRNFQLPNDI